MKDYIAGLVELIVGLSFLSGLDLINLGRVLLDEGALWVFLLVEVVEFTVQN